MIETPWTSETVSRKTRNKTDIGQFYRHKVSGRVVQVIEIYGPDSHGVQKVTHRTRHGHEVQTQTMKQFHERFKKVERWQLETGTDVSPTASL